MKIFIVLAALVILFALSSPYFLSMDNFLNILLATTTIGLLAIASAFVIGSAGLDLSVGSMMALSASGAVILATHFSLPTCSIAILCLAIGALGGAVNGYFIGYRLLPPFIVTLGTLGIFRGLALILTEGRSIYGLDESLLVIGQGKLGFIPIPVIILVITAFLSWVLLRYTRFGRHTLAIGDNEKAAWHCGISIRRHKVLLYAFSGLLAGLAGLLFMTRINAADPNAGFMYELTAITATLLGGTALFGGRASIIGTFTGALTMSVLQNGLTLLDIPSYYQQVAIGIVLIAAVAFGRKGRHAA